MSRWLLELTVIALVVVGLITVLVELNKHTIVWLFG